MPGRDRCQPENQLHAGWVQSAVGKTCPRRTSDSLPSSPVRDATPVERLGELLGERGGVASTLPIGTVGIAAAVAAGTTATVSTGVSVGRRAASSTARVTGVLGPGGGATTNLGTAMRTGWARSAACSRARLALPIDSSRFKRFIACLQRQVRTITDSV
jgi:hypothetical protein